MVKNARKIEEMLGIEEPVQKVRKTGQGESKEIRKKKGPACSFPIPKKKPGSLIPPPLRLLHSLSPRVLFLTEIHNP